MTMETPSCRCFTSKNRDDDLHSRQDGVALASTEMLDLRHDRPHWVPFGVWMFEEMAL